MTDHPAGVHLEPGSHCLGMELSAGDRRKTVIHTLKDLIPHKACPEALRPVKLKQVSFRLGALNAYVADNGLKFKEVAPPLRTALMGFMGGSHLNEIMAFLGRQETLARLARPVQGA